MCTKIEQRQGPDSVKRGERFPKEPKDTDKDKMKLGYKDIMSSPNSNKVSNIQRYQNCCMNLKELLCCVFAISCHCLGSLKEDCYEMQYVI